MRPANATKEGKAAPGIWQQRIYGFRGYHDDREAHPASDSSIETSLLTGEICNKNGRFRDQIRL